MKKLRICLQPNCNAMPQDVWGSQFVMQPTLYSTISRLKYKADVFETKLECESIEDLLKDTYNSDTWGDCVNKRAMELHDTGKHVYIMWSGGIDSTCALTGILRNWPKESLNRLTVLCNGYSIEEYPEYFIDIVSKIQHETIKTSLEEYTQKGILTTGEPADPLFGAASVRWLAKTNRLKDPNWKDNIVEIFNNQSGSKKGKEIFERYEPIADEFPGGIKYAEEFTWWFNFTQKWQINLYRLFAPETAFNNPKEAFKNIHHFYNTRYFQLWSLHNQDKRIKSTVNSYKWPAKDYIQEFTKHTSYDNKSKVSSLQNLWRHNRFNWALDEDFNYLTLDELLKYKR
jgi:hypothetical protein